jgi:hypothetical protein
VAMAWRMQRVVVWADSNWLREVTMKKVQAKYLLGRVGAAPMSVAFSLDAPTTVALASLSSFCFGRCWRVFPYCEEVLQCGRS